VVGIDWYMSMKGRALLRVCLLTELLIAALLAALFTSSKILVFIGLPCFQLLQWSKEHWYLSVLACQR
jgi:hypothetical protein